MKKIFLLCSFFLLAYASEESSQSYRGYNYVSVGMEQVQYEEDITLSSGAKVHSKAHSSSPVYISGSLVRVNKTFDFSIDISSTLLPAQVDEKWYINGDFVQQNQFDALITNMQFLGHYKFTNNHRLLAGLMYKLNSFKRYAFKDENGNLILDNTTGAKIGLTEERVATLYAAIGYGYESAPFARKKSIRYKCDLLFAKAIWNEATNTGFNKVVFNSTNSYKFIGSGYIGYTIYKNVELGCFVNYSKEQKKGVDTATDKHIKWPENTLSILQGGFSVAWNFSNN
jgi:hypothetical protein